MLTLATPKITNSKTGVGECAGEVVALVFHEVRRS